MNYMLLIYGAESVITDMNDAARGELMKEFGAFTEGIVKSGHFRAGDPLQSVKTATTVRVKDGKVLTTDGPFAETREQLGGYYLIEAKDLDEARGIAAKCPGTKIGSVEVRPVAKMGP